MEKISIPNTTNGRILILYTLHWSGNFQVNKLKIIPTTIKILANIVDANSVLAIVIIKGIEIAKASIFIYILNNAPNPIKPSIINLTLKISSPVTLNQQNLSGFKNQNLDENQNLDKNDDGIQYSVVNESVVLY